MKRMYAMEAERDATIGSGSGSGSADASSVPCVPMPHYVQAPSVATVTLAPGHANDLVLETAAPEADAAVSAINLDYRGMVAGIVFPILQARKLTLGAFRVAGQPVKDLDKLVAHLRGEFEQIGLAIVKENEESVLALTRRLVSDLLTGRTRPRLRRAVVSSRLSKPR